jgi:flagellar assembly factor FliW
MSSEPNFDASNAGTSIRLKTRFGEFEAASSNIVSFPDGLPGFERCRRFVVLRHATSSPLVCLHAVDGPSATFLAIDPRHILRRYRCVLSDADRLRLGVNAAAPLVWLTVITIAQEEELYVNLRAPIVINPERLIGMQVMPYNTLYPLRHRFDLDDALDTGTDGPSCS